MSVEHVRPNTEVLEIIAEIVQQNRIILESNRIIADRLYTPLMSMELHGLKGLAPEEDNGHPL